MTAGSTTGVPSSDAADQRWSPPQRGGKRRHWGRIALIVFGVLLLVLIATGLGAAFYASGQITRVPVEGLGSGGGPTNILIVGSDSRSDLTDEQRAQFTAGGDVGERTDTIFVLSVDGGRAGILAFPRDLYVTRCDGSQGRINAAFGIGGPSCLVRTVSALSGLEIDHYVAVDFLGFVGIVDAVGGVHVCVQRAIQDPFSGAFFEPGCQQIDGRQALSYVRVRKIDNDLERIKRQQQFLTSLADAIASPGTVVNPFRLYRTSGRVGGALTADEGLGTFDLLRLAWAARGIAGGGLVSHTVPATPRSIGGAAVLVPQTDQAEPLFAAFRDGSILEQARSGVRPQDVQVVVLNGAQVGGLAGTTADGLRAKGYQVVDIGNTEPRDDTVVRHPPGQRDAAELLASEVPADVDVVEDPGVSVVTLLLGRDLASAAQG